LISSPLIACAAIAIRLESHGPAFYKQVRAGENGKPFTLIKLRTMVEGADHMLLDVLHKSPIKGPAFKIPNDPRVTKVGRHLRRWSLDELPQFWNVMMTLALLAGLRDGDCGTITLSRQRLMVKPGRLAIEVHGRVVGF
jgi:lipopolysaccharide/colanic/teichoic acid biosynthesis glycosyltransferase